MSKGAIIGLIIGALLIGLVIIGNVLKKDESGDLQKVCQAGNACGLVTVKPERFKELLENQTGELIDLRTQEEHEDGRISDSKVVDKYGANFLSQIDSLDKTKTYLIYCNSGKRSGETLKIMKDKGFESVYNLDGGIQAWRLAGYDIVKK